MSLSNNIIKKVKSIFIKRKDIPVKEAWIHSVYDGTDREKYLDIYCVTENLDSQKENKIKIHIVYDHFYITEVNDEEWNKHCRN